MAETHLALRREFEADEGTFLLLVRGLVWDKAAFSRMERLMRAACRDLEQARSLERWMVEGFWYLSDWLPSWTGHPNFARPEPPEYYEAALARMRNLQWWLVMGQSPYTSEHHWADI